MRQGDRLYRRYPVGPFICQNPGDVGVAAFERSRKDGELGSNALKARLEWAIENFAAEHRIANEEARILLLDTGVRL